MQDDKLPFRETAPFPRGAWEMDVEICRPSSSGPSHVWKSNCMSAFAVDGMFFVPVLSCVLSYLHFTQAPA